MDRRKFIKLSALTAPILNSKIFAKNNNSTVYPIIISTWDGRSMNEEAWKILGQNGKALDAIMAAANYIENQPSCCVGIDGYPDRDGTVTLDACIMDENANIGAVAALERIKHPTAVAKMVMEKTPHVLLVGAGAQQFALENGFPLEPAKLSDDAQKVYQQWLKKSEYKPQINIEIKKNTGGPFAPDFFDDGSPNHDTMGMLALDENKNFSGAVTTSGMAFKLHGRVGDSPIIGAGLFVDNEIGAATSSGVGEEVIRICGTHLVVEFMRQGYSPEKACKKALERIVNRNVEKAKKIQVGFLAINKKGEVGAYSLQKGFSYSVKTSNKNEIYQAKYLL